MAPTSQTSNQPSNWLDGHQIPDEIKLMILEYTSSHEDLLSLIEAYPEWVLPLWDRYPSALFNRAWDNVLNDIHPNVRNETILVYYIRQVREDFATEMGSSHETEQDRDELADTLHAILNLPDDLSFLADPGLDAILGLAKVVQDVKSLTFRYSNDAWNRIRSIAEETGTGPDCSTGLDDLPTIQLTKSEEVKFNRAFLRVEIYLLTKYWTNAQGERHNLDMRAHIERFIPHGGHDLIERDEFDSCLRYIFNAYRRHLKKTAKELGAPEVPTRDDLPWVRNWAEDYNYQYEDYPATTPDNPIMEFAQRSVSEEQRFLLWLCEFGIEPLEQTHQAQNGLRRDELIQQFSRRDTWETVELRHRCSRYDYCVDEPLSRLEYRFRKHRNRHPIMSLYGRDRHQRYGAISAKWACASAFLDWKFTSPTSRTLRSRGDITLNEHGRWITLSDTDAGVGNWNPFELKGMAHYRVPHGHPYMFDRGMYEFRSLPKRVWLYSP